MFNSAFVCKHLVFHLFDLLRFLVRNIHWNVFFGIFFRNYSKTTRPTTTLLSGHLTVSHGQKVQVRLLSDRQIEKWHLFLPIHSSFFHFLVTFKRLKKRESCRNYQFVKFVKAQRNLKYDKKSAEIQNVWISLRNLELNGPKTDF